MARTAKVWKVLPNPAWCKACGICAAFCPRQVLEVEAGGKAMVVREEACSGCRLCEYRCPDLAMTVVEEDPS